MCADIVIGTIINSTLTAIALITTWLIANWYHNKKQKSDIHFDGQKNRALEDLIHRVGISFSWFKQECRHIIDKERIYEHDLVAFGTKNYDELIRVIEGNGDYVSDRRSHYLEVLTSDEYQYHTAFFNTMLRFVRTLQVKQKVDVFDEESEINWALNKLNEDLEIIKSQRKQYDEISHIMSATTTISRHSSLRLKGIKYYKASCPIY